MTDRRIKVLHIVGALNLGGAETMIMNIFRNIDRTRFQFDFYLSGNTGGFYEEEARKLGGRIINVGRRKKHPIRYCIELFRLIRREKYDVIQIHATDAQDGLPAVVARIAGAKRVCLFSHSSSGQSIWRQKFMRKLFMWAVTYPQACSEFAAKWMFGNKNDKVEIIPLPIDCERSKFDPQFRIAERKKWGINDYHVIGHIGRFQPPKNHDKLLDIFAEVVKKDTSYRLMLIGTGCLKPQIDTKIRNLGLEQYVIQMGQIDGACIELSMFDVFLMPSLYEGYPTVLLEAQANGLKSIVSSTITPTIALTDLVDFIDLDKTPQVWAETILKHDFERVNTQSYNQMIAKKHGLKTVASVFEKIYDSDI